MDNGPFVDDFPIKTSIYKGFSMAMLNNQMVPEGTCWVVNLVMEMTSQRPQGSPRPSQVRRIQKDGIGWQVV